MGTGDMGTNTKTRRIVDALDDDVAKARVARQNILRAEIRAGLGIEGEQGS